MLIAMVGFTSCSIVALALGYMALWIRINSWIRPYLTTFNRKLHNAKTDPTVQLSRTQRLYQAILKTFTTTFFGTIEGILIMLLLSLWSWQSSSFTSKPFIQLYIGLIWTIPLISFMYLKQLRKTQRILPNHPRSWAACLFIGLYALVANSSGNHTWTLVLLILIILRSQIPSFIHVYWGDTVPQLRAFEYFQIEERRAILIMSGLSIGLLGLALTVSHTNSIFHLSLQSLACLILYVWLTINADMDTPVMDITSRIFTTVFTTIIFVSTILIIRLFHLNLLTLELLIITASICSMIWYWVYGYTQKYFVRWKPVLFEIKTS
jgi:hypothetical protein